MGGFHQKEVLITKTPVNMRKGGDNYTLIRKDVYDEAIKLKSPALNVWLYLAGNTDKFHLYISSKDIAERCGFSDSTARRGILTLIEEGYLQCIDEENNSYVFYDKKPD